jgi:hypothetical protein
MAFIILSAVIGLAVFSAALSILKVRDTPGWRIVLGLVLVGASDKISDPAVSAFYGWIHSL